MAENEGERQGWRRVFHPAPHDTSEWVAMRVQIRRVSDGVVREYASDHGLLEDDGSLSTYWWSDGNGSCDCNRHLYFCRAVDEDEGDPECGDGRYQVNLYNPVDGVCHYREWDDRC